jgi:hypothetical protein
LIYQEKTIAIEVKFKRGFASLVKPLPLSFPRRGGLRG